MPLISVWYVRAALVHFAVGATAGAWQLAAPHVGLNTFVWALRPLHLEGMLVGWLCQFALGVAVWILPFSDHVSTDLRLWGAWTALNGGVAASALALWAGLPGLLLVGRGAEVLAAGLVGRVLWPRIRGLSSLN